MKKIIFALAVFLTSCKKEMPTVKTEESWNDCLMREYGFRVPCCSDGILIQGWNPDGFVKKYDSLYGVDGWEDGLQWNCDSKRIISQTFR